MIQTTFTTTLPGQGSLNPYTAHAAPAAQDNQKARSPETPLTEDTCALSRTPGTEPAQPEKNVTAQEPESFMSRFAHSKLGKSLTAAVAIGGLCAALSGCAAMPNIYGGIDIVPIIPPAPICTPYNPCGPVYYHPAPVIVPAPVFVPSPVIVPFPVW